MNRTKGFFKWNNSSSMIGRLINTSEDYKARKRTWSTGTKVWLKKFKIDLESNNGRKNV